MFNIQIKIHLRLKKADEFEKKLFIQMEKLPSELHIWFYL